MIQLLNKKIEDLIFIIGKFFIWFEQSKKEYIWKMFAISASIGGAAHVLRRSGSTVNLLEMCSSSALQYNSSSILNKLVRPHHCLLVWQVASSVHCQCSVAGGQTAGRQYWQTPLLAAPSTLHYSSLNCMHTTLALPPSVQVCYHKILICQLVHIMTKLLV